MKLFAIAATLLASTQNCIAFSPHHTKTFRTKPLNAEVLEGWKIKGDIKPVTNFILVKLAEVEEKSESGILFSKTAKVQKTEGSVVSVGPGKNHPDSGKPFPMPVETGNGVIYGEYDGTQVKIDGVTHSLIRDSDILVKYKGEKLTLDSVEAVNDYVLVYVETREAQSEGGLFLASTSEGNKRPSTGKVVKVGPGRMAEDGSLMPMTVSEGEEVKFRDYAGNEVTIGDDEYSVVQMADIIAKF